MVIYQAINIVNNNSYIGKTTQNFDKYKKQHIRHAINNSDLRRGYRKMFYTAIRKYGTDKFKWEILYKCMDSNELNEKEIYYIKLYDTYRNGYNMTEGGEGGGSINGKYERTPEIRKKISLSLMGHKRSKSSIQSQCNSLKIKHPMRGKNHTPKSIKKMSENSKGIRNSESRQWKITSPNGTIYNLIGGYHKFLKEHNLARWSMDKVYKGEKDNYKGWKIKRLPL